MNRFEVLLNCGVFSPRVHDDFLRALEALPEPTHNAKWQWLEDENPIDRLSASAIIGEVFDWQQTPQGSDYWSDIHRQMIQHDAAVAPMDELEEGDDEPPDEPPRRAHRGEPVVRVFMGDDVPLRAEEIIQRYTQPKMMKRKRDDDVTCEEI